MIDETRATSDAEAHNPALCLPVGFHSNVDPVDSFHAFNLSCIAESESTRVTVKAHSVHNVRTKKAPRRPLHTKATLRDQEGAPIVLSHFGPAEALLLAITDDLTRDGYTVLSGDIKPHGSTYLLCEPEHVPLAQRGLVIPVYPKLRKPMRAPRPFEVTDEHIEVAAAELNRLAFAGCPQVVAPLCGIAPARSVEYLQRALRAVHQPPSPEKGELALEALDRVGAWVAIKGLANHAPQRAMLEAAPIRTLLKVSDLETRSGLRFTSDQKAALSDVLSDIAKSSPMNRLLSGDVGTGKTAVFGLAAVAAAHAGAEVAILLPSEHLAHQVTVALRNWASDIAVALVTADSEPPPSANIWVGTTALFTHPPVKPTLVVIDEQQAFGHEQRQALLQRRPGQTAHLLEATATCVPRSQAIAKMGFVALSKLTQCHVEKNITTTHFQRKEGRVLFDHVGRTVSAGGKVLVIYPAKGGDTAPSHEPQLSNDSPPLMAAMDELALWEKHYPGRVAAVASGSSKSVAQRNQALIADFVAGRLPVLLSTTLLERGIDVPHLRHVVVVQPDRFGLSQLHQIRGRVARSGGEGRCDLYSPYPVAAPAAKRIERLIATTDGWEIANADMDGRGVGDLTEGSTQHGETPAPFTGRALAQAHLDAALEVLGVYSDAS